MMLLKKRNVHSYLCFLGVHIRFFQGANIQQILQSIGFRLCSQKKTFDSCESNKMVARTAPGWKGFEDVPGKQDLDPKR